MVVINETEVPLGRSTCIIGCSLLMRLAYQQPLYNRGRTESVHAVPLFSVAGRFIQRLTCACIARRRKHAAFLALTSVISLLPGKHRIVTAENQLAISH